MKNTRTTEDVILMGLYEDPDQELKPSVILNKSEYSVDSIELRKVIIELINDDLIEEGELWGTEHLIRLTGKGVTILNQHGTFDNYLEAERISQQTTLRREVGSRKRTIFFEFTTAIFGFIALVLGILTYQDKQELNEMVNQVRKLEMTVAKQKAKLDSLQQMKKDTLNRELIH